MQTAASTTRHRLSIPTSPSRNDETTSPQHMQRDYYENQSTRPQQTLAGPPIVHPQQRIEDGFGQNSWLQFGKHQHLFPRFGQTTQTVGHKRNSSGSTIASTGPSSPFTPVTQSHPYIVDAEAHNYLTPPDLGYDYVTHGKSDSSAFDNTFTNHLLPYDLRGFSTYNQNASSFTDYPQFGMKKSMAQHQQEMGNGGLLRKASTGDFAEESKSMESRNGIPKLDRTMSDIYQDELYNPNLAISTPVSQSSHRAPTTQEKNVSPRRDVFNERLQAANNGHISARSGSPADSLLRERSPFRPTSQFANDSVANNHSGSPGPRLGSVAQIRERQKAEADARAFARHHQSSTLQNSRTISPKEALLDIRDQDEDGMSSLFSSEDASRPSNQHEADMLAENHESDSIGTFQEQSRNNDARTEEDESKAQQGRRGPVSQTPQQQYPFISQPRRQNSSLQSNAESFPEFPAHLTSMESTQSDTRSSLSRSDTSEIRRPTSTTADSGTYSCTYHGCAMRFETPAKLQRHKRDGHRQGSPPIASSSDLAANRNSQAGPHKCERINPSTGKPCNSIFSRPYDLTRHEDTIHNARKQKVKCQFCTEDKTFSRNDALTRHMRVVHPEVDFPGKTKRKG